MSSRAIIAAATAVGLGIFPAASAYASKKNAREMGRFQQEIAKSERITQALDRLTFGARPGDAEAVAKIGLKKWIERQLHPASIAENPVLAQKLKTFDTLAMSGDELVRNYPTPQIVKQMVSGQMPYPTDPDRRLMIEKLTARAEGKLGQPPAQATGQADRQPLPDPALDLRGKLTPGQIRSLRTGTPSQRVTAFEALTKEQQDDVISALPGVRQVVMRDGTPEERRRAQLFQGPQQVIYRDLAEGKILRAVYSNRQLEEVLDDFWFNHFNVFVDKGADRYLVTDYERDVIRPRVLGKFRDLLEATAKSPAMLFYLDNWQSVGPNAPQRNNKQAARRGLNENYGRELLELHTLGVDSGYTQKDVTEVARCFTGWTINQPQRGGRFVFNPRLHDNGRKVALGVVIPAGGGESDGEKVLDILARSPATAHFISKKLAMRFVADDPPQALVDRMAQTFLKTNGDIRAVLETMLNSKEFWSVGAYRTKMKSPLEMVASAVRAVNGDVAYATSLMQQVANLGEPLYRKQEPTGYSNSSREWISTAGLMARMNFAMQLASNKVPGVKVETDSATPSGTVLGSPAFQKH